MRMTIAAALLLIATSVAHAQSIKEIYELQERCGRRAQEVFEREYSRVSNTKDGQMVFNYENHYSPRLNKCFFLEISVSYTQQNGKASSWKMMRLFDLNDNKPIGNFNEGTPPVFWCEVRGKQCRSEAEWRELIKPFMED